MVWIVCYLSLKYFTIFVVRMLNFTRTLVWISWVLLSANKIARFAVFLVLDPTQCQPTLRSIDLNFVGEISESLRAKL